MKDADNAGTLKVLAINIVPYPCHSNVLLPDFLSSFLVLIGIEGIWMSQGIHDKGSGSSTFEQGL